MSKLWSDVKRLWRHAALIGGLIAVACHVVPPQYRVACDALAQICRVGSSE